MASIRKHRDKYQVRIRRHGYPEQTRSFSRLSDAKEWAREIERQADRQELPPTRKALEKITLAELVMRYRDTVLPHNKAGLVETIMLNAFLRHPICKKTLSDLSASDFAAWRDERLAGTDDSKVVTPKSLKRLLSPIQHMFELAAGEWDIPLRKNPLAGFKLRVNDNKRERRLRMGEYERLVAATKALRNPYLPLIIPFALETAMRRGEMLSLRWRDIDSERQSVTVRESKNGHSRTFPLSRGAMAIVQKAERLTTTEEIAKNPVVFPTTANAIRQSWDRLIKRAGIDDLHFHDLRHEAISRLFELGLTVPEVASISGHKDMRMLFRYAHANHASIREKLGRNSKADELD